MARQKITCYQNERSLYEIKNRIEEDSKYYGMPVKTVSVTSDIHGYATYYSAIAVFEEVTGNE